MRPLLPILLILTIICFGCKKENNAIAQEENKIALLDSLSKEKATIEVLKLSPQATTELENFEDFQNFKTLMLSMST